jgi:hypothetical protein
VSRARQTHPAADVFLLLCAVVILYTLTPEVVTLIGAKP